MSHIFHYFKNLPKTTYLMSQICSPLNNCIPSNSCIYQAPPKALIPPKFAGAGPSKPSTPGVAAPTKGVVSC